MSQKGFLFINSVFYAILLINTFQEKLVRGEKNLNEHSILIDLPTSDFSYFSVSWTKLHDGRYVIIR